MKHLYYLNLTDNPKHIKAVAQVTIDMQDGMAEASVTPTNIVDFALLLSYNEAWRLSELLFQQFGIPNNLCHYNPQDQ